MVTPAVCIVCSVAINKMSTVRRPLEYVESAQQRSCTRRTSCTRVSLSRHEHQHAKWLVLTDVTVAGCRTDRQRALSTTYYRTLVHAFLKMTGPPGA
jgi:hypothetical protein